MQTAADPLVGRTLEGRYRILNRIARGGMSTVYEAVDERLDRLVAVKVMSGALSADPAFTDRFSREARAAARLTHVNAVAVYDQGVDDSDGHHVFLVMELVEGRTLRDLIRERGGRFTPAEAVSIMEPVLAALAAAHRAGLVHRDVKPENILLSDDGLIKVADFGLARAVDSDAASTRTGLMMGTVAYCAPEQITQGLADQRSDVYAAGIVLFELLTGHPPFQGDSAMNVAYQHVHSRVPAPSSAVAGIPPEIDALVIAATDINPAGRPPNAATFLAEIAEIRSDLALPVMPVPQRPREARHSAANGALPPVKPMGSDTSRTDFIGATQGAPRNDTQVVPRGLSSRSAPPPVGPPMSKSLRAKAKRRRRTLIGLIVAVLLGVGAAGGGIALVSWYDDWNHHVPKVVGLDQSAATAKLRNEGYTVVQGGSQYSDTVHAGVVISTDPSNGSRLEKGKTVTVIVSRGEHDVSVPTVSGMTLPAAESELRNNGFKFGPSPSVQTSTTIAKDKVIGTDPAAGKSVHFGTILTLIVSSGPPSVDIPQGLVGGTFDDAKAALSNVHLKAKEVDVFNDTVAKGVVISVDPPDHALFNGTVTVTVSKGPQFVTMPSFSLGDKLDDVKSQLDLLNIKYHVHKSPGPGNGNRFLYSDPAGGQQVQVGATVDIYVF